MRYVLKKSLNFWSICYISIQEMGVTFYKTATRGWAIGDSGAKIFCAIQHAELKLRINISYFLCQPVSL